MTGGDKGNGTPFTTLDPSADSTAETQSSAEPATVALAVPPVEPKMPVEAKQVPAPTPDEAAPQASEPKADKVEKGQDVQAPVEVAAAPESVSPKPTPTPTPDAEIPATAPIIKAPTDPTPQPEKKVAVVNPDGKCPKDEEDQ